MAATLEMPQYVAYQKNVIYAFIKLSAKSHSFNNLCTMDGLSCPTKLLAKNMKRIPGYIIGESSSIRTKMIFSNYNVGE